MGNGFIQDGCKTSGDFACSHVRSVQIFDLTITRYYRFVAANDGRKGTYTKLDGEDRAPIVQLGDHECLVGFYAFYNSSMSGQGKFHIELPKELFKRFNHTERISEAFRSIFGTNLMQTSRNKNRIQRL